MAINKPGTAGDAFGRSTKPYAPGEKPGVNATGPGPDMESVKTPRNTAVDPATRPDPRTGAATTPVGKRMQPPGAPNVGRNGMPPDPVPNPHIPESDLHSTTNVNIPGMTGAPGETPDLDADDPLAAEAADQIIKDEEDEPHPEHVAGKVAVKHFEEKRAAELEAGQAAMRKHPHRFK